MCLQPNQTISNLFFILKFLMNFNEKVDVVEGLCAVYMRLIERISMCARVSSCNSPLECWRCRG